MADDFRESPKKDDRLKLDKFVVCHTLDHTEYDQHIEFIHLSTNRLTNA